MIPSAPQPNAVDVQGIVDFFEHLQASDVQRMGAIYTTDARFKDPFNAVQGLDNIQRIFHHMFVALDQPRFVITQRIVQDAQCFLAWEFHFAFRQFQRGVRQTVRGSSHLMLAADGRIAWHRDYWDSAEELYAKLPVLGSVVRWLRKRGSCPP